MPNSDPDRPLPPRLIRVGDRRVLEPPERTAERNRRLNQRMEWPRWYLDPAAEPDPPHARTPLAEAMEHGELERPARGRRGADAMEGER